MTANILFQADGGKLPIVGGDSGKTATQDGAIHGSLGNFHDVERITKALGAAQRRGIINLTMRWGKSGEHQAMKRLWYRNDIPLLLDHKHRTDDCWKLRPIGKAVREYLRGTKP